MDCRTLDGVHRHCPRNVRRGRAPQGASNGRQAREGASSLNVFQIIVIMACVWTLGVIGAFAFGEDAPSIDPLPPVAAPPTVIVECGHLWTADSGVWVKVCNEGEIGQ